MKIAGVWVGWGLGDDAPKVAEIKNFLRRKFSYAKHLDTTTLYDEALTAVVMDMQGRYGIEVTGVMNYATQVRCGFLTPAPEVKPMLFTVCGTGVPWWVGPDADVARAVEHRYRWQPIGYRAAPFPMWPSIVEGRAELIRQINLFPGDINLVGYSQGAVITSLVWKYDILSPSGVLHHRLNDVKKAVTFGSPMRELGRVWTDGAGEPARADCAGIGEDRLEDTPDWWRDYARKADLYTDCEMDDEGEYKRAICKIVMGHNVFTGSDSILAQLIELGMKPLSEGIAMMKALIDAGTFFGTQTRAHVTYNPRPAIDYLLT